MTKATTKPARAPGDRLRVVLAEDHVVFRDAFKIALTTRNPIDVVGEAVDARGACRAVEEFRPDVLVSDLMLRDTDAVALLRELRRSKLSVHTLVLSRHANAVFVRDAFEAGATGYALKSESLEELGAAIAKVAQGERYVTPELARLCDEPPATEAAARFAQLSRREREILSRIVEGRSNEEIAKALFISPRTLDSHRHRMNRKLGVRSPFELMRVAIEAGLLA